MFWRNNHALLWASNPPDAKNKLAEPQSRFLKTNCGVVHRAAVKYHAADALSRVLTAGLENNELEYEIQVTLLTQARSHHGKTKSVVPCLTRRMNFVRKISKRV